MMRAALPTRLEPLIGQGVPNHPPLRGLIRGDFEERVWRDMAALLRDAAPRFPHPPRVPLTAIEADRSIRQTASAAGIATASGAPGP